MAAKRNPDRERNPKGPRVPPLHIDGGSDRRDDSANEVRKAVRPLDESSTNPRISDKGNTNSNGKGSTVGVAPVSRPVNLWMPMDTQDLSIYKRMLLGGHIRPFEMPEGVEKLANHVMEMMTMAQASGRMREAIKCIEILRLLSADNRAIAVELDRIDRLDAGKPTSITGQIAPEVQDRIKRIVSTQRAMVNMESENDARQTGASDPYGVRSNSNLGGTKSPSTSATSIETAHGDSPPAQTHPSSGNEDQKVGG